MSSDEEIDEGGRTDLEKVGLFRDGPYDTDVTLFRPDIKGNNHSVRGWPS